MRTGRSTPTESELAALADGSLDRARSDELLAQVSGSEELQSALAEQQLAVRLMGSLEDRAPVDLHTRVQAMTVFQPRRRALAPRLVALTAVTAVAVVLAAVVALDLSGGESSTQGVQRTAALVLGPATMPAPTESHAQRSELAASVEGTAFPYWRERFGWRGSGARNDRVDGRSVTTVFYSNGANQRVGYAIVAGPAWATQGGKLLWHKGVSYRLLSHDGATVVTWRRSGHLCVVSGRGVSTQTLVRLAGWSGARPATT